MLSRSTDPVLSVIYSPYHLAYLPIPMPCSLPPRAPPVPPVRGVAMGYEELMRSMVIDPRDVPVRHTKREVGNQLEALYDQYDAEDFELGIKQFMIEQAIQQVGGR